MYCLTIMPLCLGLANTGGLRVASLESECMWIVLMQQGCCLVSAAADFAGLFVAVNKPLAPLCLVCVRQFHHHHQYPGYVISTYEHPLCHHPCIKDFQATRLCVCVPLSGNNMEASNRVACVRSIVWYSLAG